LTMRCRNGADWRDGDPPGQRRATLVTACGAKLATGLPLGCTLLGTDGNPDHERAVRGDAPDASGGARTLCVVLAGATPQKCAGHACPEFDSALSRSRNTDTEKTVLASNGCRNGLAGFPPTS
jgi:hypothetical protein